MFALKQSPKKRPAPSQTGPKSKKICIDGEKSENKLRRSRPVTKPLITEVDDDDEESEEQDGTCESEGEDMSGDDVQSSSGEDMLDGESLAKDPTSARESHRAQKALLDQRRAQKPHSSLLSTAKQRWALLRQKNIPSSERQAHVKALMSVIRGKVKDIVFKHDASRIVQSVVKYGGKVEREEVATELSGHFKELAQSKYSKFLVTKLIRLCPSQRASILLEFQSSVIRMLLHREASSVLADAFELYANAYERTILLREFYGKEAILFNFTSGSLADKERAKKGLKGLLEGIDAERRKRILNSLRENLATIFNNSDKGAVTHSIVHRALWEYLCAINDVSDESEQERLRREVFESCQEVIAEMVHTKDGSRVVREFLAQGTAKDRKHILKVLKPHIERMCLDDEAQMVLFTALDVTDDTKLLSKALITPIISSSEKLYPSPQGRRSLLYLVVPRSRRHFTPAQISCVAETDNIRSQTSKKGAETREEEVRKAASEDLVTWVEKEGENLVKEPNGCLVVVEVMLYAEADKEGAMETLLRALTPPASGEPDVQPHLIDLPPTSRLYKTLLQGGHYDRTSQAISRIQPSIWDSTAFASKFVRQVGKEATVGMCTGQGNGAFVVAELAEALLRGSSNDITEGQWVKEATDAKEALKGWFGEEVLRQIEHGDAKGKNVLLEKLRVL